MRIWWMPRIEDNETMQPCLGIYTGKYLYAIRFGKEQFKSFSERYQGTMGIPIQWRYLFGGRLSFLRKPVPDDRKYPRFPQEGMVYEGEWREKDE